MARARNIKPGFFTNDELGELPPLARLLFAGLWTLCDRDGRVEDRPRKIKAEVLPYDACDADVLLDALHHRGFIQRYTVDGVRLIQVTKWAKHQTPHIKEAASILPAPDEHSASTVQAPDETVPLPERAHLIPDSLIPDSTTDSIEPTSDDVGCARPPVEAPSLALVEAEKPKAWSPPDCPHLEILSLWGEVLPAMPQHLPSQWKGARADHLRARWRETATEKAWGDAADGIAYFRRLFAYIGQSRFLTGRTKVRGDARPFVIELEWLVCPTNWAKVHEGKYHQEAA